ncbi:MAG: DUF1934 domain-containing protein [Culicoidibacterales bacterium]
MLTKKVLFSSTVTLNGEIEQTSYIVDAHIKVKDGALQILTFIEPKMAESEKETMTKIIIDGGKLELIRNGEAYMSQVFQENTQSTGKYETTYGHFITRARTTKLDISGDEKSGKIKISYDLFLSDVESGHFELKIAYQD